MTRNEVVAQFNVVDGVIRSPGKFEGEPLYTPYFWELALDGIGGEEESDEGDVLITTFEVDGTDTAEFPELAGVKQVSVYEDDLGFVHIETVPVKDSS